MSYLLWLLRAALFILLLGFAIKNDQPIVLQYFFGYEWRASLVVILFSFFAGGVLIGVLGMLASMFRQRRELSALKRELQLKNKLSEIEETQQSPFQPS
ncbi:MAG: LapA family protein [Gallionellaceae bacterium]|jgi:uncharacterized integral membrane protein